MDKIYSEIKSRALREYVQIYKRQKFQPMDDYLRCLIHSRLEEILVQFHADRKIQFYKVVCDLTNNTPEMINSGYFPRVDIYYKSLLNADGYEQIRFTDKDLQDTLIETYTEVSE